jgi:hypothetical protein
MIQEIAAVLTDFTNLVEAWNNKTIPTEIDLFDKMEELKEKLAEALRLQKEEAV